MTIDQEEHLRRLKDDFIRRVDTKYRAGAKEHGGNLQDVPVEALLEYAMEEVEDLWVYLFTLQEQVFRLKGSADTP